MPPWVSEHIGEIALLIYILYPILKRWWDRRKERAAKREAEKPAEARTKSPAKKPAKKRAKKPAKPTSREDAPRKRPARAESAPKRPTGRDFLEAARGRAARLEVEAERLLQRAERDPRLVRLVPALREDLLVRVQTIKRSLDGTPTLSTIMQDTTVMQGLEELLRYLATMARQRTAAPSSFLADADTMADACYAPILEFARVQSLSLRTSQPVAITGDWGLSIVPRFASTRVAPLRLPAGFDSEVWHWPAIAHEVAHDFYYSLEGIEEGLRARLSLPSNVAMPLSESELGGGWLRQLFGAWLSEVFADTVGTVMLGPAYAEAMHQAFRNPDSPQRTAAIFQDGGIIDEHPPDRLRIYMATRVLHHLGRHEEADAIWERWEADHPGVAFYYLPLGGDWVGLSDENLHTVADAMVDVLLQRPWPELQGFQLLNIPGLAYLHAEHATVQRLIPALARGETLDEDPRWIIAAAVLAAGAQPALRDAILETARRSIRGIGEAPEPALPPARRPASIPRALAASLRSPAAFQEAITLSAALSRGHAAPRKHPYSR